MAKRSFYRVALLVAGLLLAWPYSGQANNLRIANLKLMYTDRAAHTTAVVFDLSWENSWRATWVETDTGGHGNQTFTNWDAAWVFIKYRLRSGANTNWQHLHLAPSGHAAPVGITIAPGASAGTNMGVFVYRAVNGYGALEIPKLRLRWDYGAQGVSLDDPIDISVQAIEMVYVPEGAFYIGSGGPDINRFYAGGTVNDPFRVTSEAELTVADSAGGLWYTIDVGPSSGGHPGDRLGPIPANFPKGYTAFYCMKYDATQGQYAYFLNRLTSNQANNRYAVSSSGDRYSLSKTGSEYSAARPDRSCNWISWADMCAYADWAGLRPLTELEYEKACRGPKYPLANEYAWGTSTLMANAQRTISGTEDGTETIINPSAAAGGCNYENLAHAGGDAGTGPLRAGIWATNGADRVSAGASYWGIMELSGNVWLRTVTVGHPAGRLFTGLPGDGQLASDGNANVSGWPGIDAGGGNVRGGSWKDQRLRSQVSDRYYGAFQSAVRINSSGLRAARSAP